MFQAGVCFWVRVCTYPVPQLGDLSLDKEVPVLFLHRELRSACDCAEAIASASIIIAINSCTLASQIDTFYFTRTLPLQRSTGTRWFSTPLILYSSTGHVTMYGYEV